MKYKDSEAFRRALDQKLKEQAQHNGRTQDFVRLQVQVAIERFMARIDPDVAMIKGGAATMYTVPNAPHTRDVDLIISEKIVAALGLDKMTPDDCADELHGLVQDQLVAGAKGDFFRFKVEACFPITDLKPGHACARANITVMVGKGELHFLQVDIALQNEDVPSNLQPGRDLLSFAEVANPTVRIVTPEYLVADKVTLYLEEHGKQDADRVKDIVHAALIIDQVPLNNAELTQQLANRASHREVLNKLEEPIPAPPERWTDRFEELMEPTNSNMTIAEAVDLIRETIHPLCPGALEKIKQNIAKAVSPAAADRLNEPKALNESEQKRTPKRRVGPPQK